MRIYTRRGDDGTTGLLFGGRVSKDSAALAALGDVDEAQSALGVARACASSGSELDDLLVRVERDLWVLMAELAADPADRHRLSPGSTMVTPAMVSALEPLIDDVMARFEPPREFVLPGQTPGAAALDLARAVVRRAERSAVTVAPPGSRAVAYLNRLSDLLWALARWQEGEARPARQPLADPE